MNKNNKISFVIAIIILLFILILFFTLRFEKNADVKNVSILDCKTCQDIQTRTATEKLKLSEITEYLYSGEINKTHAINLLTEVEKRIDSINSIIRKELPSFRLLTFSELLDAQSILKNDTTDFDKKNLLSLEYALVADGDLLSEILKIDDEYTKIKESFFKGDIKHDEAVNHILSLEKKLNEVIEFHKAGQAIENKIYYYDKFGKEINELEIRFSAIGNILPDLATTQKELIEDYFSFSKLLQMGNYGKDEVDIVEEKILNLTEELNKLAVFYHIEEEIALESQKIEDLKVLEERVNIIYFYINELEKLDCECAGI